MLNLLLPILAVLIGFFLAIWFSNSKQMSLKLLLTFSGAFLLSTTVFELLPAVYSKLEPKLSGLYILAGIIFQIILEFFSKGAEHGHLHGRRSNTKTFPLLMFLSLGVHAFLEGFPVFAHQTIVYGVFVHKIPVAILIVSYLLLSKLPKFQAFVFIIVFAFLTPLGTLAAQTIHLSEKLIYSVNSLVIGMFLHIATIILFEADEGHKFNLNKIVAIVCAVLIAFFM